MSHGVHTTKDGDQRARVVATFMIGFAGIGIWWPILGSGVLWGVVMLAVAAWLIVRGPAPRSPRFQIALAAAWPVWIVLAVLLAGLPPSVFSFGALGNTKDELLRGLFELRQAGGSDSWSLAAWLAGSGAAWFFGGIQASRPNRSSVALAFFMLAVPFAMALLLQRAEDAPWHGAVILAGALLWATRSELRAALPAIAAVAVVGLVVSALIGPSERAFSLNGVQPPSGSTGLNSDQTYGPMRGDQSGATMFEITSPKGGLWRMETLSWFTGRGWSIGPREPKDLPQPAAVATTTRVRIVDLRDDRVAAPGRIESAVSAGRGQAQPVRGEAAAFPAAPTKGDTYTVISEVVDPPRAKLERIAVPADPQYAPFTHLVGVSPVDPAIRSIRFGNATNDARWEQVGALARQLAAGTTSQLEIVERVESYLVDSGRFRYSLKDVPPAGNDPLVDFLTVSRVGYCQHFAGAAALLLRMAGVPTRVVVGFATGTPKSSDSYEVLDEEAHAWIEVYFPGAGWVPFNPTPPDAQAQIDPEVGVTPPASKPDPIGADDQSPLTGALVLAVLAVIGLLALAWQRLRRPHDAGPLGEVLVRLVPAPAGPAMTLTELRADLIKIGPAVAALAEQAEWQRFGTSSVPPERHPGRRVLRALLSDIGPLGTAKLLILGPGRRPVIDEEAAAAIAASVAPPGASTAPPGAA